MAEEKELETRVTALEEKFSELVAIVKVLNALIQKLLAGDK